MGLQAVLVPTEERASPAHSSAGLPLRRRALSCRARRAVVGTALIAGDLLSITIVAGLVKLFDSAVGLSSVPDAKVAFGMGAPTLILGLFAVGLYGRCGSEPIERFRLRTIATAFSAGSLAIWATWSAGGLKLMPDIFVGFLLATATGHYVENFVRGLLIRQELWGAATVVLGDRAAAVALAKTLSAQPELGLRPVAIVDETSRVSGQDPDTRLPIISSPKEVVGLTRSLEVAVCASGASEAFRSDWLAALPFQEVLVAHQAPSLETLRLRTRCLGSVVGLEMRRAILLPHNLRLKRLVDLAIGVPAAILALPLVAALALVIKLVDPGPAFYVQPRVGRNGRTIPVLKLRSMFVDAEERLQAHLARNEGARLEWERFCKLSNDPRVLPLVGQLIRRSSLDELPQLWNVIRGEMSVVGPRPFPSYHTERFDPEFQALRASVPPGLTGLWQVCSRSDGDLDAQKQHDSFYIQNWSIWVDLYVLLQTVPAVLATKGAR